MRTNEIVAYAISFVVVVIIVYDIIIENKVEPEHYTVLAGLVTAILGIRQKQAEAKGNSKK